MRLAKAKEWGFAVCLSQVCESVGKLMSYCKYKFSAGGLEYDIDGIVYGQ